MKLSRTISFKANVNLTPFNANGTFKWNLACATSLRGDTSINTAKLEKLVFAS